MMKRSFLAVLMLAALVVPTQANLLVNGNFEAGDLSGWWIWLEDPDNESITLDTDYVYEGNGSVRFFSASDVWSAQLGQEVVIGENEDYTISFMYSARWTPDWGSAAVGVNYYDADWVWLDYEWVALYDGEPGPNAEGEWLSYVGNFTTPAGTGNLSLRFEAANWTTVNIDNVVLVPEPASILMLGLGGLVLCRRKSC